MEPHEALTLWRAQHQKRASVHSWRAPDLVDFADAIELAARKYGATFTRTLVFALCLGAAVIGEMTARYIWIRYHVLPTPARERTFPIPAEERSRDAVMGVIQIAGADWAGVVEGRPRGDVAFLFTFVSTTFQACASFAGPPQSVSFAWRFDGGAGFSPLEQTGTP